MGTISFFTDVLGANLRNPRWSWGAFDPMTNRVYLRVWEHDIESSRTGRRVLVATEEQRLAGRRQPGFAERHNHVKLIRDGAAAFGVVCTAVDPETNGVRSIKSFDDKMLVRFGRLIEEDRSTYAEIDGEVPVSEIARQRTAASMLTEDLQSLSKRRIDATTKDTLMNARVGQGRFRDEVLRLWGNRCAVTESTTLDAVRASHIQPWRKSTDQERLDPYNGLPLVACLDALFDAGLISFEDSGALVVSSRLSEKEKEIFGLSSPRFLVQRPRAETIRYLAYHRREPFKE